MPEQAVLPGVLDAIDWDELDKFINTTAQPLAENPKDRQGAKKVQLHLVPPVAVCFEAEVFTLGAKKYGPFNWREKAVLKSVYCSAALRHMLAMQDGEWSDPESGMPHAAHVRACMAILLDAECLGKLHDDMLLKGSAAEILAELADMHKEQELAGK